MPKSWVPTWRCDRAGAVDPHARELRGRAAGVLDVDRDPDAAQAAAPARFGAPPGKAGPVDRLEPAVEIALELRWRVDRPRRRMPGHLRWRDQVAPPQLDPVDPGLARRGVDQALEQVAELGARDAAVGGDRRGVGEHAFEREMVGRDPVGAAHHRRHPVHEHEHRAGRQIAAVAPGRADPDREEAAVAIQSQSAAQALAARLGVGDEALAALRDPLHRTAERPGGEQDQDELGIDDVARAEAAADVGNHHADRLLGDREDTREHRPQLVRRLAAGVQGVTVLGAVVAAERGARLHERDDLPRILDLELHDMGRGAQLRGDGLAIAHLPVERAIARQLRPEQRRVLGKRGLDRRGRRQRPVMDLDQIRGIARLRLSVSATTTATGSPT